MNQIPSPLLPEFSATFYLRDKYSQIHIGSFRFISHFIPNSFLLYYSILLFLPPLPFLPDNNKQQDQEYNNYPNQNKPDYRRIYLLLFRYHAEDFIGAKHCYLHIIACLILA